MANEEDIKNIIYSFKSEARYLQSDLSTLIGGVSRGNIPIEDAKKITGKIRDRSEELQSLVNRLEGLTREDRSED